MNKHDFPGLQENIKRNIGEIRSAVGDPAILEPPSRGLFDRSVYLFQSVARSMISIGNDIIIENGYRSPLNTADVFISLAEHGVIPPAVIPAMKRAAIVLPRINVCPQAELVVLIANCLDDLSRCLSCYDSYFKKRKKTENGGKECK